MVHGSTSGCMSRETENIVLQFYFTYGLQWLKELPGNALLQQKNEPYDLLSSVSISHELCVGTSSQYMHHHGHFD